MIGNSRISGGQTVLVLAAFGASLALGVAIAALEFSVEGVLVLATAIVLAVPIVRRVERGTFDLFEPMTAFCVTYGVLFVVRTGYMFINDDDFLLIGTEVAYLGDTFVPMQLVALLGAIGFVVPYELGLGNAIGRRLPAPHNPGANTLALGGLITLVFGVLGTMMYISAIPGGFGALLAGRTQGLGIALTQTSGYLVFLPTLLVPASLLLYLAWHMSRKTSYLVYSLAAAALIIAVRGPTGGRVTLIPLIGGALVLWFLLRDRRPRLGAVVVTVVVGMFLWTLVGQVRNEETRRSEGVQGIATNLVNDPLTMIDPITEGQDAAMGPALAAGMSVIPSEIPFFNGTGILQDFAVRGIPRSLWPEKPVAPREQFVSLLWSGGYNKGIANPEPSILFSFYAEIGYPGVLIGMAVVAFLFRAALTYFRRFQANPVMLLIYAVFLASIPTILRDSPTDSVVKVGFTIVPILAIAWFGRDRGHAGPVT